MLAPGLQDSLASVPFCKEHKSDLDVFGEKVDEFTEQLGAGSVGVSTSGIEVTREMTEYHLELIEMFSGFELSEFSRLPGSLPSLSHRHLVLRPHEPHHGQRQDLKRSPGGDSERLLGNKVSDHHRQHDRGLLDPGRVLRRGLDVVRSDRRISLHPDPARPHH